MDALSPRIEMRHRIWERVRAGIVDSERRRRRRARLAAAAAGFAGAAAVLVPVLVRTLI